MRWHEIGGGIRIPLSQEERDILKKVKSNGDLDERDEEVARRMVSRGVLRFGKKDGKETFEPDETGDLWRN